MRNGFKIFGADAHVIEPKNLWERFLDSKYQHRVCWRQPFEGVDLAVLYGPGYDMWLEGIDPDLQAAMARARHLC